MNKILCCLFVAMMLSSCCGFRLDGTKCVGDIIRVNGRLGVVFEVEYGGKHGKVLSVTETKCDWEEAQQWCRDRGGEWRLPTVEESKEVYRNLDKINRALKHNRYRLCKPIDMAGFWSCEESASDPDFVRIVHMSDGTTCIGLNFFDRRTRAVSTF